LCFCLTSAEKRKVNKCPRKRVADKGEKNKPMKLRKEKRRKSPYWAGKSELFLFEGEGEERTGIVDGPRTWKRKGGRRKSL